MTSVYLNVNQNEVGENRTYLDVIAFTMLPYVAVVKKENIKLVKGFLVDLLDIYDKKYNVCYRIRETRDSNGYGVKLSNGSYNGMMGEAQRRETDLLLTPLSVMYDRLAAIDFSTSFDTADHTFLVQYPKFEADIIGFMKPFTLTSWIYLFISVAVMYAIFSILARVSSRSTEKWEDGILREKASSHPFILSLALFLGQATDITKFNIRDRLVLSLWLLDILIVTSVYKSNLNAMMTAPRISLPFNSLEELLDKAPMPHRLSIGSFIHVASLTGRCKTTRTKETFLEVNVAVGLPKNQPWKTDLDDVILLIREAGIVSHWMKNALPNATYCLISSNMINQSLKPLALKDFYGIFGLLLGGVALSTILFLCEVMLGLLQKKRQPSLATPPYPK